MAQLFAAIEMEITEQKLHHRGLSTGPKTKEGRIRCAEAKTIHGRETRQQRADTSSKLGELYELEVMARAAGVITGPRVRGRTPGS